MYLIYAIYSVCIYNFDIYITDASYAYIYCAVSPLKCTRDLYFNKHFPSICILISFRCFLFSFPRTMHAHNFLMNVQLQRSGPCTAAAPTAQCPAHYYARQHPLCCRPASYVSSPWQKALRCENGSGWLLLLPQLLLLFLLLLLLLLCGCCCAVFFCWHWLNFACQMRAKLASLSWLTLFCRPNEALSVHMIW